MSDHEERRPDFPGRDSHERHEPDVWHEPTDRSAPREDDHEQHAGNGTVNHRPDDQGPQEAWPGRAAPDASAADRFERESDEADDRPGAGAGSVDGRTGADGLGAGRDRLMAALGGSRGKGPGSGQAPDTDEPVRDLQGLASDELALRRMLHQAVDDIEPRDGALERLRHAVPARRARKRQALVGMAAAALFIGTAVPALIHVSDATGLDADPSIAGQASRAQDGTGQSKGPDGGSTSVAGTGGTSGDKGWTGQKDKEGKGRGTTGGATGGASPTASVQTAPGCTVAQLGGAKATTGAPDSTGTVYGTFRVANVSTTACTVSGGGSVTTAPQGAADPSKISVVNHVAGDPATGLPDPSQEVASLVLKPGEAYEVKFAWVPSETCPSAGDGTGGPSPDPSPSESVGTGSGTISDSGGTAPQLMPEDGVADGSVVVSHTSVTGSGTSTATVSNACAGTVYRTGMLPAT
ncbi:hypothetical protein [Streptomyces sp. NPDC047079]|uniref:hypothetical protein n=1 Tax=Streptomyces sp. NPDC047079 TaxID=3154607 RepID=UPI00340DD11A